jgi:hypothetical protein
LRSAVGLRPVDRQDVDAVPAEASSAMAPAGAPPVKKKASSEPSFILSPAWLGLMYSGLMSASFTP